MDRSTYAGAIAGEVLPCCFYPAHELNSLVLGHRQLLYKLLFDASSQTLLTFAKDPTYLDALPGIISVLHTWGQQLSFHPHIHCIVSGGGITPDNKWKDEGLIKVPLELRLKEQLGIEVSECPVCKGKTLRLVAVYNPWKKGDDG